MWLTSGVKTSIAWPKEEQTVIFDGIEIEILPETKDDMPMVRIDCGKYGMTTDQGLEFLNRFYSSLSWSNKGYIYEKLSLGTGMKGGRIGKGPIFSTITTRFDDDYMPTNLNEKQSLALALYREAQYINNITYKYLGYFKILNIQNQHGSDHKKWINQNLAKVKSTSALTILKKLQSAHGDIGNYLYTSGRCAVAHAFDQNNLVNPDNRDDLIRLHSEFDLIQELAEIFIESELGLKSKSTFYKEHLYELEGIKDLFTPDQINAINSKDPNVLKELKLPGFSVGEQHSKLLDTFTNMKVTGLDFSTNGLLVKLTDKKEILSILISFDFINEKLGWDLIEYVELIPEKPSVDLYKSLIDLSNFKFQMFRNGRFSVYDGSTGKQLGRTDAFIPVNIDLGRTLENFKQEIANYEKEIETLSKP